MASRTGRQHREEVWPMGEQALVEQARRELSARRAGEVAALRELYALEVAWHIEGHHLPAAAD